MTRRGFAFSLLTMCLAAPLVGCMPKMTIEQMKEMKPQRPAELDKLNAFAGTWQWTGEAKMAGLDQVLKMTATGTGQWEGDGWYLVSRGTGNMDELGEMKSLETMTYDARAKKYRSTWVDSMGSMGTGVFRHDDKTNTWHVKATGHGPMGKSKMKGKVRVIDDNTIEWEWAEYAFFGLFKTMEMKGTGKRMK